MGLARRVVVVVAVAFGLIPWHYLPMSVCLLALILSLYVCVQYYAAVVALLLYYYCHFSNDDGWRARSCPCCVVYLQVVLLAMQPDLIFLIVIVRLVIEL